MSSEYAAFRLEHDDLALNLELSHDRVCNLRKPLVAGELRITAARALRRARAAEIVAAWQAAELTEEQAARLLGWECDPVAARSLLQKILKDCKFRWALRLPTVLKTLD
jgi:hypothetical protein